MTVIWRDGSCGTAALILQLRSRLGGLSASRLATLLPSEELPVIHWVGSCVCPRADLDVLEKSLTTARNQTTILRLHKQYPLSWLSTLCFLKILCLTYNITLQLTYIILNLNNVLRNYIISYYFTFIGQKIRFTKREIKTICNFDTCRWIT